MRPLQVGAGPPGFILWIPVEKLSQTQIGFDAAAISAMAAPLFLRTLVSSKPVSIA